MSPANGPVAAGARTGHVHPQVADLDRALAFYAGVLGFQVRLAGHVTRRLDLEDLLREAAPVP